MNKKISTITGIILLIIATFVIGKVILIENKETASFHKEKQNEPLSNDNEFNSFLSPAREELTFSIPEDSIIPAGCLTCKEKNIDLIEGQYWNFAISPDYKNYAYPISENNKVRVIFNKGKKKIYDIVYLLKFSPDSKDFLYHAYDESNNLTYLVYNDKELVAYSGREGWPQAANGFTEAFSEDSKHFAYSRILGKDNNVEIILDGKIINTVKGFDASMIWFNGHTVEYIINLKSRNGNFYDYDYYRGSEFIKTLNFDEFNQIQTKNDEIFQTEIKNDNSIKLDEKNKSVLVNGNEIVNYKNNDPEVYLSHLIQDNLKKNFVYMVTTNIVKDDVWVSLNGKDSENKYNSIKDIHFSQDGEELIYIARRGRNVYKVTHEIVSSQ
jgi:hypothetical protein